MIREFLDVLPLAVLGAVLGLDVVSFPQAQISRPLVAATLAGALIGHAMEGLLAGAALELIALETLPVGASRYPEWGSAAVVGGALFASQPDSTPGAMSISVLAALATASVGGWSMVALRTWNARFAGRRRDRLEYGSRGAVVGLQVLGLTADLARGGVLTMVALLAMRPIMRASLSLWTVDGRWSRAVVAGMAATVAMGAVWKLFHTTAAARWYLAGGLVLGLAILAGR
jgi:mannose/fructose/N-acetylgalactosamine-specific phosphotransferase system component IIC